MRDRIFGIGSSLNLRERVDLSAGGGALVAAVFLTAIGDVSWILPLAISSWYAMVVFATFRRAGRHQSKPLGNEGGSERQSMRRRGFARPSAQGALSVAYWSFFMVVLGLVIAWAAVSQLTGQSQSAFSFVLLSIGVLLIGLGVFAMANLWRRQSK
jgi:hypothetical protein